MDLEAVQAALGAALLIFGLRVVDISLYTLRIVMVADGYKRLAWIFAFLQATVYVNALRIVFSDLGNWPKVIGYALGFATGLVVGMIIEQRLAIGHRYLRIISPTRGDQIAERLRADGFGVTEIPGKGLEGVVDIITTSARRREINKIVAMVDEIDETAFITAEKISPVRKVSFRF
ncbi:MAG TPA: DUF5698 domain-containing protein [Anaerolineales bacterium]|nr:DUF5698 domain-containing protein [Anaerolineales bacterium]